MLNKLNLTSYKLTLDVCAPVAFATCVTGPRGQRRNYEKANETKCFQRRLSFLHKIGIAKKIMTVAICMVKFLS